MRQAKSFFDTKARAEPRLWSSERDRKLTAVSVGFAVGGLVTLPVLLPVLVFVPEFIAVTAIRMLVT
jgi:hypothetical protein